MESIGLTDIVQNKLKSWWVYIAQMLPNFLLAIIVLTLFYFVGKLLRNLTGSFFLRVSKSQSVSGLLSGVIYTVMIIAGVMTALDILELDKTVSSLLAGVGIIGLALGFAFQDLTSNFISGAFIALKRPFDVGHIIETNGFLGTVEDIHLRSTSLKTSAGLHVIIPNKDVFQKPIINYSRTEGRRVELDFVLPLTADVLSIENQILDTLYELKTKNGIYGIEFYYTAIENPHIKINVSFWTKRIEPREFMGVRHEGIIAIYNKLRETGIYKTS